MDREFHKFLVERGPRKLGLQGEEYPLLYLGLSEQGPSPMFVDNKSATVWFAFWDGHPLGIISGQGPGPEEASILRRDLWAIGAELMSVLECKHLLTITWQDLIALIVKKCEEYEARATKSRKRREQRRARAVA